MESETRIISSAAIYATRPKKMNLSAVSDDYTRRRDQLYRNMASNNASWRRSDLYNAICDRMPDQHRIARIIKIILPLFSSCDLSGRVFNTGSHIFYSIASGCALLGQMSSLIEFKDLPIYYTALKCALETSSVFFIFINAPVPLGITRLLSIVLYLYNTLSNNSSLSSQDYFLTVLAILYAGALMTGCAEMSLIYLGVRSALFLLGAYESYNSGDYLLGGIALAVSGFIACQATPVATIVYDRWGPQ